MSRVLSASTAYSIVAAHRRPVRGHDVSCIADHEQIARLGLRDQVRIDFRIGTGDAQHDRLLLHGSQLPEEFPPRRLLLAAELLCTFHDGSHDPTLQWFLWVNGVHPRPCAAQVFAQAFATSGLHFSSKGPIARAGLSGSSGGTPCHLLAVMPKPAWLGRIEDPTASKPWLVLGLGRPVSPIFRGPKAGSPRRGFRAQHSASSFNSVRGHPIRSAPLAPRVLTWPGMQPPPRDPTGSFRALVFRVWPSLPAAFSRTAVRLSKHPPSTEALRLAFPRWWLNCLKVSSRATAAHQQ